MNDKPQTTSIDRIAEELSCWAGSGAMIIDHMARWRSARHPNTTPSRCSGG